MRICDDRTDCFLGQSLVLALPRGRPPGDGRRAQVVDYRRIIHSLRQKPMGLLHLVYRDALFPHLAYRAAWERLLEMRGARLACRVMVERLALVHEHGCEADLTAALTEQLDSGGIPDLTPLRIRFAPAATPLPVIMLHTPAMASYDTLLPADAASAAAIAGVDLMASGQHG